MKQIEKIKSVHLNIAYQQSKAENTPQSYLLDTSQTKCLRFETYLIVLFCLRKKYWKHTIHRNVNTVTDRTQFFTVCKNICL